jgi:murein L,D-transpeptidase YcbB/YkuD
MADVRRTIGVVVIAAAALAGPSAHQQALWLDEAGNLRPDAREAISLLQGAAAEGLDPRDYPIPDADAPSVDAALTASVLRYLEDVRFGRVDPRALGFGIPPRDRLDLEAMLRDAVAQRRLGALAAELSPSIPMYAELRRELARYRTLAGEAQRVRQIELSLERLRWLPRFPPQRILAVNIPMFRVWGMGDPSVPTFSTAVIVGRAFRTRTPVLVEEMEYAIFRPYWNIPTSIVHGEILPALRRAPDYLQRHAMEIVSGDSDAARVVAMTDGNIARLRQGPLRLRQRPGPQNALGLIKFVFPNDENVYIHGTPVPELFARARRDFSHGCIRVADPVGLAEWVLSNEPGWSRERIVAAMEGPDSTRADLSHPIPVILFYLTAMPIGGAMHFADDIYGHDARLDRYLEAARGHRPATE